MFIYLKDSDRERGRRDRDRKSETDQSQEPGTPSWFPTWVGGRNEDMSRKWD